MKKAISLLLIALLLCGVALSAGTEEKPYAGQTLTISTFSFNAELLQKNIYDPFEALTGAKIVPEVGNNATRITRLTEADEGTYDVVVIGDIFVQQLMAAGKIDTMEPVANLADIYEAARAPMGAEYGPAYSITRLGIVYNPEDCPVEIKSFADLWNPELADSVAIPAITTSSGPLFYYGTAAAFGLTPGQDDEAIFAKLAELKPNVKSTYTSANNTITMLNQGEISVGVLLDYSYVTALAGTPELKWVEPAEGSFCCYNMLNIVAGSQKKELAREFINFYLSYEVQYAEAMDGVDAPVRMDVVLDEDHRANFLYGEMFDSLILPDANLVGEKMAQWTDMWNNTFGVQ